MSTIEKIAQEVVLLDASDAKTVRKVRKMLLDLADSTSASPEISQIAKQAAGLCQKLSKSKNVDEDLKLLNDLIDGLQKQEDAAGTDRDPMAIIDDAMVSEFLGNQESVLEEFEANCMDLENGNREQYAALKRQIHTWKGESAILGFTELSSSMHTVEDALEDLKEGDYSPIPDALLKLKDMLAEYFEALKKNDATKFGDLSEIVGILRSPGGAPLTPDSTVPQEIETPPAVAEIAAPAEKAAPIPQQAFEARDFPIPPDVDQELVQEFRTESDEHIQNAEVALMTLESDPTDMDAVNVVFRAFHTIKGVASFIGVDHITELAHKAENLLDRVRKGQLVLEGSNTDLAFEALDLLKTTISSLDKSIEAGKYRAPATYFRLKHRLEHPEEAVAESSGPRAPRKEPIGEILVSEGKSTPEAVEKALESQADGDPRLLGELLVEENGARAADVVQAVRAQSGDQQANRQQNGEATVKVSTTRLDNLINSVGELVIAQSMVSQDPSIQQSTNQNLARNVSQLAKITRSLQELALSMRMVSVKPTFQKMARLVRDLARKSGKDVAFEMYGEDTELDRNMVEAIADPLVHMVRNAVDHGIEPTELRSQTDKPTRGLVTLSAAHEGGSVVITLTDDGRGLNKEKIYAKAVERGLIEANAQITDTDMYNLIFQPGFSTADKVTDVSGRGVGMDVVRTNIEKLRGSVLIESTPGRGSVFKMRLPLTLAIIDGMVIRIGQHRYIIPTVAITESFRPQPQDIVTVQGRTEMVTLRGELIPICRLHHIFDIPDSRERVTEGILVVAEAKNSRIGLLADELLGQQQVVIKRLGDVFKSLQSISGGAILGDGTVSLILDVDGLIQLYHEVPKVALAGFAQPEHGSLAVQ